jgi:hypothetical protein
MRLKAVRDDLLLEASQQPLRFGQGQTQIGDIGEITGPFDLHDVSGLSLTFSVDFHQPQNPGHPSTPGQRTGAEIPPLTLTPQNLRQSPSLARHKLTAVDAVRAIACKAQTRLCQRYRHMMAKGKPRQVVVTAIARELAGFIWSIACVTSDSPATDNAVTVSHDRVI